MKAWGTRNQIFIGLWVIAGLAVVGMNGFALMSLMDQPLAGYSAGVRQVNLGFQQYRRLLNAETMDLSSGMDRLVQRFAIKAPMVESQEASDKRQPPMKVEKKVKSPPVTLPVLAGIVTSRRASGEEYRLALLNDGLFSEGDMLKNFTIRKISGDGVLVAKGKKTWFLQRPDIAYSLSQP